MGLESCVAAPQIVGGRGEEGKNFVFGRTNKYGVESLQVRWPRPTSAKTLSIPVMPLIKCQFCTEPERYFPTTKGLRSHQAQDKKCKGRAAKKTVEDVDSASDTDVSADSDRDVPDSDSEESDAGLPSGDFEHPPFVAADVEMDEGNDTAPEQSKKRHRTTVEDVEDDDTNDPRSTYYNHEASQDPWVRDFPSPAGSPIRECQTKFQEFRNRQRDRGDEPWAPFKSEADWELARWLMESGASQTKIDSFLKLESVRGLTSKVSKFCLPISQITKGVEPLYRNSRAFMKFVDSLPRGPAFHCTPMKLVGDLKAANGLDQQTEVLELWHRDPVECVRELLGNPSFRKNQFYAPEQHFRSKDGTNRQYDEMWTADWWWKIQVRRSIEC